MRMITTEPVEQRWRGGTARWRRPSDRPLFDPACYGVTLIQDDTTARTYIEAHHYSRSYVAAIHRFGLYQLLPLPGQQPAWTGPRLAGVAVLSNPMNTKVLTNVYPDLAPGSEALELGRLVLDDSVGFNGESWTLAEIWRQAFELGVRGLVMFSDPVPRTTLEGWHGQPAAVVFAGHIGQIYQAVNCDHLGTSTPRRNYLMPDARVLSARAAQKIRKFEQGWRYASEFLRTYSGGPPLTEADDPRRWLQERLASARARAVKHDGCLRYAYRLGPNARARAGIAIAMEALQYPVWDAGQLPLWS
jgi:hypothetical protein